MAVRIENQAEPIPGYRLIERIGGGGFGEVWKCEAPGGLHKAIKFVFGDLGAAGEDGHRAEQELKALSRVKTVRHPYILSLERFDIIDGQLLIVMELADRNLWDRYKECRAQGLPGIPRDELLSYMQETAEALDLMNGLYQLQHLDIKPQNLFLVHQHIKVADFGLVKDLEGMKASVTGGVTPVYASPETFDGYVSRFSDQYSFGIVYQELLTGQRPFNGTNVRQLILQHLQAEPNVSSLPKAEQPIIARALSKNPEERHPTCMSLILALREAGLQAVPEKPPTGSGVVPIIGRPQHETKDDLGPHTTQQAATARIRSKSPGSSPGTTTFIRSLVSPLRSSDPGLRKAPAEVSGEGVLFPALVIGLGQVGMQVLQQLRYGLASGLGSPETLAHIRLLLLDTDPEVLRQATRGARAPGNDVPGVHPELAEGKLTAAEVALAPLNRPSYYLKSRDSQAKLEKWFNLRMLYRIPRSQVTTGVRALGRLAFCDNYRVVISRLKREIDALLDPTDLIAAAGQTRLGIRTNRPRIYVVCSLAGGTGSGMFLDLAYNLRAMMRSAGFDQPDVVALFLLPGLDNHRTRTLTLGNAYAALSELTYYATPGTLFRAKYHENEPPLEDAAPPFGRCVMLRLPDETDEVATRDVVALAGQYLYRDLCSPLGRQADLVRAGMPSPPWETRGLFYQTFGMYRLTWPRRELFELVGRRLCRRLVERWMSKDSKPLREGVQKWVEEQWARHELGADVFIDRLGRECVQKLGRPPESAFKEVLQSLVEKYGNGSANGTKSAGALGPRAPTKVVLGTAPKQPEMAAEEVADALAQLDELLGSPGEDNSPEARGTIAQLLREAAKSLSQFWGQKLAEMTVRLIEQPEFRLAGAEESVRQVVATIEQILQHQEPLCKDLNEKAQEANGRLRLLAAGNANQLAGGIGRRAPSLPATDVLELLRFYAKWRYQSLVLNLTSASFVTLRGHLADEMREINFCRVRLAELQRMLEEPGIVPRERKPAANPSASRAATMIFPSGCKDLLSAAEELMASVGPEAVQELDNRMEAMLKQQFTALVHVCLSEANVLGAVHRAMLDTAGTFVAGLIPPTDVAKMFLEQHPAEGEAEKEVGAYFDKAAPPVLAQQAPNTKGTIKPVSLSVLVTPSGDATQRFREVTEEALAGVEIHMTSGGSNSGDDVIIYREVSNLPLADLEHLGPAAWDAYAQMSNTDHFTPHSRMDVNFIQK
jgi:serine/threonine protein kinase